jgi:hypothetical protein
MARDNIASHHTVLDARNTVSEAKFYWQTLADALDDRNQKFKFSVMRWACGSQSQRIWIGKCFQQMKNNVDAAAS